MDPDCQSPLFSSPAQTVFALPDLLEIILKYVATSGSTQDILRYRCVNHLWNHCTSKLYKGPPLKFSFNKSGQARLPHLFCPGYKCLLPMDVTITHKLTPDALAFLQFYSENITGLHFERVYGAQWDNIVKFRNLTTLTVDKWSHFKQPETSFLLGFINHVALMGVDAQKFKTLKIEYDHSLSRTKRDRKKGPFCFEITDVVVQNCNLFLLDRQLLEICNRDEVDFHFLPGLAGKLTSVTLNVPICKHRVILFNRVMQKLSFLKLKHLRINFGDVVENILFLPKLEHLETLHTNVCIATYNVLVPLSECLPKLVSLKCTGGLVGSLATIFDSSGTTFEHLEELFFLGSMFNCHFEEDQAIAQGYEWRMISKARVHGFPGFPKLKKLTLVGFSRTLIKTVAPLVIGQAKNLRVVNFDIM